MLFQGTSASTHRPVELQSTVSEREKKKKKITRHRCRPCAVQHLSLGTTGLLSVGFAAVGGDCEEGGRPRWHGRPAAEKLGWKSRARWPGSQPGWENFGREQQGAAHACTPAFPGVPSSLPGCPRSPPPELIIQHSLEQKLLQNEAAETWSGLSLGLFI